MKLSALSPSSKKTARVESSPRSPSSPSTPDSKPASKPSQGLFSSSFSSSSRPVGHGPQRSGGSSFTPSRPSSNPHLANPADTGSMRPQIAQQAQNHPSFYGRLVSMVNGGLQQGGIGISPASHQSVLHNLEQVHSGKMSQSTAHFTEAASFAQDAVNSFKHGRPVQGLVETSGVALNTVGGVGMSFLQGLGRTAQGATPSELHGNDPW